MHPAHPDHASPVELHHTSSAGGAIRTLSVSLLAVAAVAASLLLTRRPEQPANGLVPAGENLPAEQSLDAIRAAGL